MARKKENICDNHFIFYKLQSHNSTPQTLYWHTAHYLISKFIQVSIPEFSDLAERLKAFHIDGAPASADRYLSDLIRDVLRKSYTDRSSIEYLVHYTTIDTLFSILANPIKPNQSEERQEFLRIYDTFHSNDPCEGSFFIQSAPPDHDFLENYPILWEFLQHQSQMPAYLAAFVGVSDLSESDNLDYWRTYGKDGMGCSIAFPVERILPEEPLFIVQYGDSEVLSCLDNLSQVLNELSALPPEVFPANAFESPPNIPISITSVLSPLTYLHKAKEYSSEKEARIVVPYSDLPPDALFFHEMRGTGSGNMLRHYAHIPALGIRNILRTDSVITLGPSIPSPSKLQFALDHLLHKVWLLGADTRVSKKKYRSL